MFFLTSILYAKENLSTLLKDNDFALEMVNNDGTYNGLIIFNHGEITCNYGTEYIYLQSIGNRIENNRLYIDYVYSVFNVLGIPSFRDFDFPKYYEIVITEKQIKKRIESIKYNEIPNTSKQIKGACDVLIICDNLRIREQPNTNSSTKIVGKLRKWDKLTAIACTEAKEKIDNLEYPWYKIRLKDGTEGWVFGGFAKIYFSDDDLQLLYKAFEKEGSEYINQFITPDES